MRSNRLSFKEECIPTVTGVLLKDRPWYSATCLLDSTSITVVTMVSKAMQVKEGHKHVRGMELKVRVELGES